MTFKEAFFKCTKEYINHLLHQLFNLFYSEGSVKVIFRVIVKVLKPSKETNDVVAVNVGRKISKQLKTGRIGNIQVARDAIQLRGNITYTTPSHVPKCSVVIDFDINDIQKKRKHALQSLWFILFRLPLFFQYFDLC